jgi:pimeloyl-ACP methyl ester carboxylesterase
MDRIRAALGEEKITYFGFSYGSELGATWVTKFPSTVRAAVFDGATDPNADYVQSGLDQAKGFETELTKFLAQCSSTPDCAFRCQSVAIYSKASRRESRNCVNSSCTSNVLIIFMVVA